MGRMEGDLPLYASTTELRPSDYAADVARSRCKVVLYCLITFLVAIVLAEGTFRGIYFAAEYRTAKGSGLLSEECFVQLPGYIVKKFHDVYFLEQVASDPWFPHLRDDLMRASRQYSDKVYHLLNQFARQRELRDKSFNVDPAVVTTIVTIAYIIASMVLMFVPCGAKARYDFQRRYSRIDGMKRKVSHMVVAFLQMYLWCFFVLGLYRLVRICCADCSANF